MQQLPSSVKHAAGIAPRRQVRIVTPEGEHRVLSDDAKPSEQDQNVKQIAELIERAAGLNEQLCANMAMFNAVAIDVRESQEQFKEAMANMKAAMSSVVASVESLERAFYAPVIPVYDDEGKIKAAQRIRR